MSTSSNWKCRLSVERGRIDRKYHLIAVGLERVWRNNVRLCQWHLEVLGELMRPTDDWRCRLRDDRINVFSNASLFFRIEQARLPVSICGFRIGLMNWRAQTIRQLYPFFLLKIRIARKNAASFSLGSISMLVGMQRSLYQDRSCKCRFSLPHCSFYILAAGERRHNAVVWNFVQEDRTDCLIPQSLGIDQKLARPNPNLSFSPRDRLWSRQGQLARSRHEP